MSKSQVNEVSPTSRRATYQDVLDAPSNKVAEIVNGKLYLSPRPAIPHAIAGSSLGGLINQRFQFGSGGPSGWWILNKPELHLGDDIVVPDIAGWRRERLPVPPNDAYFTLAPDWVCEVLSPATKKLDLSGKKKIYAREGVAYHWFVDPTARSSAAYELVRTKWVLIEELYDDATVSLPPFEAVSFSLSDLWPPHTVHKGIPSNLRSETEPKEAGVAK